MKLVEEGVESVDGALVEMGRAVVQGVPGYVLSTGIIKMKEKEKEK